MIVSRVPQEFYADPAIRSRLVEFLGGRSLSTATTVFVVTSDGDWDRPRPTGDLVQCLEEGAEVARSLWDRESMIAHLDIEYVNFDHAMAPYFEPERIFDIQRPVVRAIQEFLLTYGISPLHLLSGRGHHFVWRVRRDGKAFSLLSRLGRTPQSLDTRYLLPQSPESEVVGLKLGSAFAGLGQVLEFVTHNVLNAVDGHCELPVEVTAVEAGPRSRGREIISIDLSEYGDPLYTRSIRMPFGVYLKAQHQGKHMGETLTESLPILFMIPLHEMDDRQGLLVRRDMGETMKLARRASVQIPEQTDGMVSLVAEYECSALARFHRYFYEADHDLPEDWPRTYDQTRLDLLPLCARRILQEPNDLLLKPAAVQHIVRVLMGVGWHPRHIAGLIRSKFERDHGWGDRWHRYDAATRADFYTRLFAGLLVGGKDPLIDFNCRSTQEKGYCPQGECHDNLENLHGSLCSTVAKLEHLITPHMERRP